MSKLTREHWDKRFMRLALEVRSWVKGPDAGVGAVITDTRNRVRSVGYSGLPRGMLDNNERLTDPEFKDQYMVHAELNAILNATTQLDGCTLYATKAPCTKCAAAILQAGIARVVSPAPDKESRWHQNQVEARGLLRAMLISVDTAP